MDSTLYGLGVILSETGIFFGSDFVSIAFKIDGNMPKNWDGRNSGISRAYHRRGRVCNPILVDYERTARLEDRGSVYIEEVSSTSANLISNVPSQLFPKHLAALELPESGPLLNHSPLKMRTGG